MRCATTGLTGWFTSIAVTISRKQTAFHNSLDTIGSNQRPVLRRPFKFRH